MNRIVAHFSCGAASAIATKLAIAQYGHEAVTIFNVYVEEEDKDNRRFLADCERWFAHPVIVLRDEKYGASAREVWRRERFIKSAFGASCSQRLKRDVLEAASRPDDKHVFGFTFDERHKQRVKNGQKVGWLMPLIERNLTHADCLAMIERAGIVLPLRYRQGFHNANCIGCCKGGEGYWNKERELNPNDFIEVSKIEMSIGPGAFLFRNRKSGKRFPLSALPADAGRHDEEVPECSFYCDLAEDEYADAAPPEEERVVRHHDESL